MPAISTDSTPSKGAGRTRAGVWAKRLAGSLAALVLLWGPGADAQSVPQGLGGLQGWTNQAGHVLQAELVRYTAGIVTFRTVAGESLTLALSALGAGDQRRIREAYRESSAPAYAVAALRDARAVIARYDRLTPERRSNEERERIVASARDLFDNRLAGAGAAGASPDAKADMARLRASLQ